MDKKTLRKGRKKVHGNTEANKEKWIQRQSEKEGKKSWKY